MRASFELTEEHPSKAHDYVSRSYHFFSLVRSFFVAQQKAVTHFCHKIRIGKYCNNHHHHHHTSANLFYAVFCKKRAKPSSNDNLNSKVLNVAGTNKNTPQNSFSILHVIFFTLALFGRDHHSQVIFGA